MNGSRCLREAIRFDVSAAYWIALSLVEVPSPKHSARKLMDLSGMLSSVSEPKSCEDVAELMLLDVAHYLKNDDRNLHDHRFLSLEASNQRIFLCRTRERIETGLHGALVKVVEQSKNVEEMLQTHVFNLHRLAAKYNAA